MGKGYWCGFSVTCRVAVIVPPPTGATFLAGDGRVITSRFCAGLFNRRVRADMLHTGGKRSGQRNMGYRICLGIFGRRLGAFSWLWKMLFIRGSIVAPVRCLWGAIAVQIRLRLFGQGGALLPFLRIAAKFAPDGFAQRADLRGRQFS